MPEFELAFATRQIRRAFARAVGKSVPKIITELITNADDSYRRLEQTTPQTAVAQPETDLRLITVVFERPKRRFTVTDHAEGLTDKEMEERFVTYGQESSDRSAGIRTRSLFGKGLRDVLFTQQYGQVKSVKGGLFYNCRFRWKQAGAQERPVVDIKAPGRVTKELREALGITMDGTAVEFKLADGVRTPQTPKLLRELSQFYMLRMINSSPHREVRLRVIGRNGAVQLDEQLAYRFPTMDVRDELEETMSPDTGENIFIRGKIGLTDQELSQGEVGYVDREGGLLLVDENDAVLDLHLFGFDDDPAARRISGVLQLLAAGEYIRGKLNAREPEEVLTETRDGLDKTHEFYVALKERIRPRLEPIVAALRELGPQPKMRLSDRTQARHQQALELLNRLANDMLGKTARVPVVPGSLRTPPADGIAFANSHISVQARVVTPAALLVNTAIVRPLDTILIASNSQEVEVSPQEVSVDDSAGTLVVKIIRIFSAYDGKKAEITARWRDKQAVMGVVTTAREVITPVNGLEFERDEYGARLGATRHLRLFIDLLKVAPGSSIATVAESPAVLLAKPTYNLLPIHSITEKVAAVDLSVRGQAKADSVLVSASFGEYVAGTRVSVTDKERPERGMQGLFKDYKFVPLERRVQSLFSPEGSILINTRDPVNSRYFGAEPYAAVEHDLHCQVRLADLILTECLWVMVSQALEGGKLDRRFPDNPEVDVRNYVDEKKFEIGPAVHKLIVTSQT